MLILKRSGKSDESALEAVDMLEFCPPCAPLFVRVEAKSELSWDTGHGTKMHNS